MSAVNEQMARLALPNKKAFYETMIGIGWHLPALSDSIMTMNYLTNVRHGIWYCLKRGPYDSENPIRNLVPIAVPNEKLILKLDVFDEL